MVPCGRTQLAGEFSAIPIDKQRQRHAANAEVRSCIAGSVDIVDLELPAYGTNALVA